MEMTGKDKKKNKGKFKWQHQYLLSVLNLIYLPLIGSIGWLIRGIISYHSSELNL